MSSTVTGSLPPEGRHGGHLGGWGPRGHHTWGEDPQPSHLLLSMNSSGERRGTWLPDPEASVSSPPPNPDLSHPEAWLVCVCMCVSHSVVYNSLPPHGL